MCNINKLCVSVFELHSRKSNEKKNLKKKSWLWLWKRGCPRSEESHRPRVASTIHKVGQPLPSNFSEGIFVNVEIFTRLRSSAFLFCATGENAGITPPPIRCVSRLGFILACDVSMPCSPPISSWATDVLYLNSLYFRDLYDVG